jgi:stage II sporulation protein D
LGQIAPDRTVSVLLQSGRRVGFSGATRAGARPLDVHTGYFLRAGSAGMVSLATASGRVLARLPAPVPVSGPGPITLDGLAQNGVRGGSYRGSLRISADAGALEVVDVVGIETYLRGVVPAESPPSWPAAELQAQAIAARSFAVASAPQQGFDLFADGRSQRYAGMSVEAPATDAAVAATAGEVVTYGGAPIMAYYFPSSGGETEDIQNSFLGAAAEPYLRGVADPFDDRRFGPMTMTLATADARLRGIVEGTLRAIVVTGRGVSPRIVSARVVGSRGSRTVSGPQLAAALGLPSTWACFAMTPPSGAPAPGWDAACHVSGATGPTGPASPPNGGTPAPSP